MWIYIKFKQRRLDIFSSATKLYVKILHLSVPLVDVIFILKFMPFFVHQVEERPSSFEAQGHCFCTSVLSPILVLSDLVQRGMAQADEVNQVRPKFKKRLDDCVDQLPENRQASNGKPEMDQSYDESSSTTADPGVNAYFLPLLLICFTNATVQSLG